MLGGVLGAVGGGYSLEQRLLVGALGALQLLVFGSSSAAFDPGPLEPKTSTDRDDKCKLVEKNPIINAFHKLVWSPEIR